MSNVSLICQSARFNRAHGFIYIRNRAMPPMICNKHENNDPRRGMNVVICAWVSRTGEVIQLCHQSLN